MSTLLLVAHQCRYEWRAFWRNPARAFFSVVFPLIFLLIFNLLFGNDVITVPGGTTHASTFFIPAIAALSVINSCFTGLAMGAAIARDDGILKRVRGTPLPPWAYLASRIIISTLVAVLVVAIVVGTGALFFHVTLRAGHLPAFFVAIILGAAACSGLGLAVTALIPNADAAPAVVNAIALPLLFISDIFIRGERAPVWLHRIANIFPFRHLSLALQTAFNPFGTSSGFDWPDLRALLIWVVIGALLTRRFFSWEPRR